MKITIDSKRTIAGLLVSACLAFAPQAFADGAVYAMTNARGNNQILVYHRANNGMLSLAQTIATTGGGSGTQLDGTDSLGSQGSLMLDQNHRHLFAVNTESTASLPMGDCQQGSISSFSVASDGTLTFVEKTPSGGLFPNSLTVNPFNNLLYVLNAGGPGTNPICGQGPNITGFTISGSGKLTPIAGSTKPINPGMSPGSFLTCDPGGFPAAAGCGQNPPAFPRSPGEVAFDRLGIALVVTVKGTNSIYVFPVGLFDGKPGTPTITKAAGPTQPTYFGFAFDFLDRLIVAEPFGTTATIPAQPDSAVSSFGIGFNGALHEISTDVPNGQGLSCWVVYAGEYAYISDNGTGGIGGMGNISAYKVGLNGSVTLVSASAAEVSHPNDMGLATDQFGIPRFLYVLEGGSGSVGAMQINSNGSLTPLQTVTGLPVSAGAQGLAAY